MKTERQIKDVSELVEKAYQHDRYCPICNGLIEQCSCKKALEWVLEKEESEVGKENLKARIENRIKGEKK